MNPTERRTAASSSTRCTSRSPESVIGHLGYRQCEPENRAAFRVRFEPDAAAVRFDDRAADRKADSHAGLLGRDERLEKLRRQCVADTGTGVLDVDGDEPCTRLRRYRE